jgi:two-component system CheB/CheR fusion protein
VALLNTLRARGDTTPLILITGSGGIGLAVQAMRMGACDFIEKPVSTAMLVASIERALAEAEDLRAADAAHEEAAALVSGLTSRQYEVMTMVLAGHPSKNIASDLAISQRTVENHRAAVMRRMRVHSLPELARLVMVAEREV